MPAVSKETVWEIADRLNEGVVPLPVVEQAATVLKQHMIELHMRPPDPAKGRIKGCSRPQMNYWKVFDDNILGQGNKRVIVASGANQCCVGSTMIPSPDGAMAIADIVGRHRVYAWDGEKQVVAWANEPFVKGLEECYRYHLSNGEFIECSDRHLFLAADGHWRHAGDLRLAFLRHRSFAGESDRSRGQAFAPSSCGAFSPASQVSTYRGSLLQSPPCLPLTTSDTCLSVLGEDVRRSTKTVASSQGGCRRSRHLCDEPPPTEEGIGQGVFPSQGDARARSDRPWRKGVPANTRGRIRRDREFGHLSNRGVLALSVDRCAGIGYRDACTPLQSSGSHSSVAQKSTSGFSHRQSTGGFDRRAIHGLRTCLPLLMTPNGVTSIIACEPIGCHQIYDFEVPGYHNYIAAGVINHNSGKTAAVACSFCRFLRDHAQNRDVFWVIAQSYQTLKDIPFKSIYDFLPPSMFPKGREKYDPSVHEIPPLVMNLPDGRGTCEVWFKSEESGLEKFESSRLRGIWWTECGSHALYDALLPRLLARGGFMLCDLIPFHGWHRTVLREKASQPNSPIHYEKFVVMDNAHNLSEGAVERMKATMSKKMWEIRGLGREAAAQGTVFQNFDPEIHTCRPFKIPDWWPLYMAADWGFNAPHCFALFAVAPNETVYVVAEHYESQMSVFDTVVACWEMVNAIRPLRLYDGFTNASDMFDAMRRMDFRKRTVSQEDFTLDSEDAPANHLRTWITEQFTAALVSACNIDNQVFQRHGSSATLSQEFAMAGLPIRPAVKRSVDASVETVRRMFDSNKLILFDTCYKIREDVVSWSYKAGKDMTVLDNDKYDHKNSHGVDALRYGVQMGMSHAIHADPLAV